MKIYICLRRKVLYSLKNIVEENIINILMHFTSFLDRTNYNMQEIQMFSIINHEFQEIQDIELLSKIQSSHP